MAGIDAGIVCSMLTAAGVGLSMMMARCMRAHFAVRVLAAVVLVAVVVTLIAAVVWAFAAMKWTDLRVVDVVIGWAVGVVTGLWAWLKRRRSDVVGD